ncbi:MAG: adenylate/guanylate cyclase domain-containing protein, partial [Jaaginema sp. PMC 1079.18]|nr:adenylate/guanylate cyclase domain-containing protein [Jaaginema sp. PMC 1079.18]
PYNLLLLEELLLSEGYSIESASSGRQAIALAQAQIPDLVLLDVMMPDMDGFEVCQTLRSDEKLQGVPIVFLTALDDEEARLKGLEMMGDDYITKPINSRLLLAKIKSLLKLNTIRNPQQPSQLEQKSRDRAQAAWQVSEHLSEKFRLFVPEQFLNRIAPQGVDSIQLGNAREEELTIVFADIRSFTAISETQPAQDTFRWLNAFFTQMNEAIAAHHGFIDKFLGDAIMAVFDRQDYHAQDAIAAAIGMLRSLTAFNQQRETYNLPEAIKIGIGIHSGIGVIGTVGSDSRMDSTVIGDVVNTAARLEELTKTYHCDIIASAQAIAKTSPNYEFRYLDTIAPRGKQQALKIYQVVSSQLC